jgi:SAM-dependent methyltransferase
MRERRAGDSERVDYDREAEAYHGARAVPLDGLEQWRCAIAGYLSSTPVRRVLDVGSGTGEFARALAHWFTLDVVGVEPSAGMRRTACLTPDPRVSYIAGRAEALPLRARSCGGAWLSTVIHHIDLAACAQELRRVLVAAAPVLVRSAFPGRLEGITLFRYFPEARRTVAAFPTVEHVARDFAAGGFSIEHVEDVPQVSAASTRAFLDRVRGGRHADSALAGLSEEAFGRGIRALEREAAAETTPRPVIDLLTLLVAR